METAKRKFTHRTHNAYTRQYKQDQIEVDEINLAYFTEKSGSNSEFWVKNCIF